MKFAARTTLITIALVTIGSLVFYKRFEIEASVWHWRNGDFVQIKNYKIPVPNFWLVKGAESGPTLLIPSRLKRSGPFLSDISVATVDVLSKPPRDLDFWKSFKEKQLKTNGVGIVEAKTFSFSDEAVACIGSHEFHELMQLPESSTIISVDCLSTGGLHLMFVGQQPDLDIFYSIIPKIRAQE